MKTRLNIDEFKAHLSCMCVASAHTTMKQRGKSLVGLCPIHNEKSPSFYIDTIKDRYTCFGCGSKGDSLDLVCEINQVSKSDGLKMYNQYVNGNVHFVSTHTEVPTFTETKIKVTKYELVSDSTGSWYWNNHYVSTDLLIELGLFFIREIEITTDQGTRIVRYGNDFPAFGYQSGDAWKVYVPLADKSFKHFWTDRVDTKEHWFPTVKTLRTHSTRIIICAGQKDAIVLTSRGYCAVTSTLSESGRITEAAIKELREFADEICICYDTDTTGKKFSRLQAETHGLTIVHLPELTGIKDISDFAWNNLFPHGKTLEQIGARFETVNK